MSDKKKGVKTINNIENLNLEIDYDKLAEAIVKAKNEAKTKEKASPTSTAFNLITCIILRASALLGVIVSIAGFISTYKISLKLSWYGFATIVVNSSIITIVAALSLISILFAILLEKSVRELQNEKDKNYIIAVFSGLVSFAALVVALIALLK